MQDPINNLVSSTDWISQDDLAALATACGPTPRAEHHLRQLLLAIPYQLSALLENGCVSQDAVDLVLDIQRRKSVPVNPLGNRFTRNPHRFGRGFDLRSLAADPAKMAGMFDRLAPHWEEYVTAGQYRAVFSWLAKSSLGLSPSLRTSGQFLDLACGVGLMGQILRLTGVEGHLTGVDLSSGMLAKAHARGCYDVLLDADVNKGLPVPDRCVDIAICTGAMELLDVDAVLRECHRVVKLGGCLWVTFQHDDGVSPNPTAHQHIAGLSEEDIVRRLRNWGLYVISVERCPVAFVTPSGQGKLEGVPYLFVRSERRL